MGRPQAEGHYENAQNPELNAILARLSQFSQPQPQKRPAPQDGADLAQSLIPQAQQTPQPENLPAQRPIIDPATITTWKEGIRCVTKIAAQSKSFEANIRKMMQDQRAQEMKWYAQRQELKRVQASRTASTAQALEILKALNPNAGSTSTVDTESELKELDVKIYQDQLVLHDVMSLQLKSLGVPFFGTPEALIVDVKSDSKDDLPSYSQPVTEQELRALQVRMIEHLEDLYRT